MSLSHSLTTVDVLKIRDGIKIRWPDWPDADIVRSTRTEVHAAIHLQCPTPCTSVTPEMKASADRREPLTYAELEARHNYQRSQVTPEQHDAFQRARASGDRNALNCKDAHHHVQMLHGTALWTETDRLCAEAGVK